MTGVLSVDKPPGPTSHDVVARVRRALSVRRVGHFGTLDPFASGLLVCGVGPATRLAPFCVSHAKTYLARVRLGWTSSTDDAEGELRATGAAEPPPAAAVAAACQRWIGEVEQVPPAFSAKHVDGRRAYARARAGERVELPPSRVRIDRIEILAYDWPDLELRVECGPGTYIRALARDLGADLGTGAHCGALRRTRSGPFDVDAAVSWESLADPATVRGALAGPEAAVSDLPVAELDAAAAAAAAAGRTVPAPDGTAGGDGWVRLRGPGGFMGLAERVEEAGSARLQPRRLLYPENAAPGNPAPENPAPEKAAP